MIAYVENIGDIEFPDGTDIEVIKSTVKKLLEAKKTEPTFMDKYLPSVKRTGEIYQEEVASGIGSMKEAARKPTGKNILNGFLGALQYGFAPLTASVKGLVREPIQDTMESAGVPHKVADFAGEMIETGMYFVPYGKMVQQAVVGKKALETTKAASKAVKQAARPAKTTNKALKHPEAIPEKAIADATKPISEAHNKILRTETIDEVVDALKKPVAESWKPAEKRVTQEIIDYMVSKPEEIEGIARAYKLSPEQLTAQIKETMTLAGRDLGRMGRLAKDIKHKFQTPYMQQLTETLERELPETTTMDKFGKAFKTVENVRRSALVSQFATTMRNIISQGARLTLGSVDDAFQGAANAYLKSGGETTFNSVKTTLRGLGEGLDSWVATINRLRPKERAKLTELLNSSNAISAKAKMFTTPVQDVVLTNKISKTLNYFNTTQEYFFRNIAFEAKLRQLAQRSGIDYKALGKADIPEKMFEEAADYALEMTFAAMPKSTFGKDFVRSMSNPIFTAMLNPFPRFLYGNALPFLKKFSPLGYLDAIKPSVVADIVSGHPEKFTKAVSQATLGTIMLNTATHIRNSEFAGERWYEVKVGEKYYDTRAFAPFSTYLFIAESMQHPERIKPADFGSALLSLNRIGGTGLVLSDIMRGRDFETTINALEKLGGAYLSGFTVPAKTLKDIYTSVDEEEAILRDIKGNEFWGPMQQNIPELSQKSPKAKTPLKAGDIKTESPILRQFTGLSYRTKNNLQKEVDRVQLGYQKIYPGTGDAEGDRTVNEIMGNILNVMYPILETKTDYMQLDELTRRIILGELFADVKKEARTILMKSNPQLALKIKIDDIPEDLKKLLRSRGVLQ